MKKKLLLFAGALLFLATSANAGSFITLSYGTAASGDIAGLKNPNQYQTTVFTLGTRVGPNFPPAMGGNLIVIDITDRTREQLIDIIQLSKRASGRRYKVLVANMPPLMRQEIFYRGFLTTKWAEIRNYIWDKDKMQTLAGKNWRWVYYEGDLSDNCHDNCDYQACQEIDPYMDVSDSCDCEEYAGRTFCHRKNRYSYSDVYDH